MTIVSDFVASNPSMAGVSDKVILPKKDELLALSLVHLSADDLKLMYDSEVYRASDKQKTRKSGKSQGRKAMRFPAPHLHSDYSYQVFCYFQRWGRRFLNDAYQLGMLTAPLDAEALADFFLMILNRKGSAYIHAHRDENGIQAAKWGMSYQQADRLTLNAAVALVDDWTPDYIRDRVEMGRAGGMRSKRPKVYTAEHLARVAHLSKRDAAQALGCSESTISRLRRDAAACVR